MLNITVIVPVDKTNFESMAKTLSKAGMNIKSINDGLGLFHGEIINEHKAKELCKIEGIVFVSFPTSQIVFDRL
jgi:hypothetical protein